MSHPIQDMSEGTKHLIDAVSIMWLGTVFIASLPAITAVLSAIWVVMRIHQTRQEIRLNKIKLEREAAE